MYLAPEIKTIETQADFTVLLIDTTHFPTNLVSEKHLVHATQKRRIERAAADYLIQYLLNNKDAFVENDNSGKPFCTAFDGNISLTHSKHFVALQASKKFECGIDLQIIEERIIRLKEKFLNPNELSFLQHIKKEDAAEIITKAWSIKEVVYKTLGAGFHDYHYGFTIRPFELIDQEVICDVDTEGISESYKIKISRYEQFSLAFRIG